MPQLPELPRWLKICGIAVIVLGVISCGIGGVRSFEQAPSSEDKPPTWLRIPAAPVPRADVELEETSSCAWATPPANTSRFTASGGSKCSLMVDPELLPRDLRLRVISASGLVRKMTVGQEIRGELRTSEEAVPAPTMEPIAIRVTQSRVTVTVECTNTCTFEVIE